MSNQKTTLDAIVRTEAGKGAARRTRAGGHVPAVIYGQKKEPLMIGVDPKALTKALTGPLKRNALLEVSLKDASGKSHGTRNVLVKELQINPVKRNPIHIDFLEVALGTPVVARVPLEIVGKSKATVAGARATLTVRTVKVAVAPESIPEKIVVDTTDADFGTLRAKILKLPAGVTLVDSPELAIVSLRMPRGEKEEEAAPAAGAAPAAAAAAAPAADKKK